MATERVASAVAAARASGLVLTARAENHLYGHPDLDDTIARLQAYAAAGADVVYAPGLARLEDIARVVAEVDRPVNVLALPVGRPSPSWPRSTSAASPPAASSRAPPTAPWSPPPPSCATPARRPTPTRAISSADVAAAFGA